MRLFSLEQLHSRKPRPRINGLTTDEEDRQDCHSSPASSTLGPILLDIIERIQETFNDVQFELGTWTAEDDSGRGRAIIQMLQKELPPMIEELQAIVARDRFNLASSTHNTAQDLDQMIDEFVAVWRVAKFFRELVSLKKSLEFYHPETATALGDISGGSGGIGNDGRIGDKGGEGTGPQLHMNPDERWKIGNICGGLGGNGGKWSRKRRQGRSRQGPSDQIAPKLVTKSDS
ncbi:hypothetical protein MSAN_02438900 [Mycena sanguinolenta]|uniref:Uncharacterized protein n=1 Tax=Mycena sanguinolenta TaxID=230812 RepID=A0A8H6WYT9_9AGAR|nr:hypothetical protein MSAN_02438900 [Mycena sanguinolenta]